MGQDAREQDAKITRRKGSRTGLGRLVDYCLLPSAFCLLPSAFRLPLSAFRFRVGKLIRKSAGLNHQRQPVRIRPQPPSLRSGVTGNTLGFDPRDSRFDPWLRSLRTWPNGSGACLRNKSMQVQLLSSALFEYGSVAQMDRERRFTKAKAASSSLAGVIVLRWSRWL